MSVSYSLQKAEELCKEYQYLRGRRFAPGSLATIDCVVVAPFDQENRNRFIIYYLLLDDAQIALRQDHHGPLFDVIIIAGAKDGDQMVHESLDVWLAKTISVTARL